MAKTKEELREARKQWFAPMERYRLRLREADMKQNVVLPLHE